MLLLFWLSFWSLLNAERTGTFSRPEKGKVVDLTSANFDIHTKEDTWFLDFYAPWCGHCKKLAPIWDKAAETMSPKIRMGKIDCTTSTDLRDRFNIKGFPTLLILRDGAHRVYKGPREVKDLLAFGKSMTRPPVAMFSDAEWTLHGFPVEGDFIQSPVVFMFFGDLSSDAYVAFKTVAYRSQGLHHFLAHKAGEADKIKEAHNIVETDLPVMATANNEYPKFEGTFSIEEIQKYVDEHMLPLVSNLTGKNFEDVTMLTGLRTAIAVVNPADNDTVTEYREKMADMAHRFKNDFTMALIDAVEHYEYLDRFGVANSVPTVFVLDAKAEYYYVNTNQTITPKNLFGFLSDVRNGKIQGKSVHPWYSLHRYNRLLYSYLTETQVMVLAGVVVVVLGGLFVYFCLGPEEYMNEEEMKQALRDMGMEAKVDPRPATVATKAEKAD